MQRYIILFLLITTISYGQERVPASYSQDIYQIISDISAVEIEKTITQLAVFGTRNTMSDTVSETRGIGAARRWIKTSFDNISSSCRNCLNVSYQRTLVKGNAKSGICGRLGANSSRWRLVYFQG